MTKRDMAPIALGTWSWGAGMYGGDAVFGNHLDTADLKAVVDTAIANGLTTFDTAYAYGMGDSERIVGELLATHPRDSYVLSDKFTPGLQDDSAENPVLTMLEGSLDRLGMETIDIYWIHNASDVERWTPFLVEAVASGKIKRIGVSNHSLEQVKRVQEILKPAGLGISAVQNHFSLLYRQSIDDGLLDYCQKEGITFFSYMVLEQGALSGKYDSDHLLPADSLRGQSYNPLFPAMGDLLAALRRLAEAYDVTVAQLVTAWAIAKGTVPILGVTSVAQVTEAATASHISLKPSDVADLENLAIASGIDTRGGWEGQA